MTDEELVALAKSGDKAAEEYILKKYSRFARSIANSFFSYPDKDDLFQEGMVGLYGAIVRYDGEKAGFSTFAYACVRNKILDEVKKSGGAKNCALNDFLPIAQLGEELYYTGETAEDEVIRREQKSEFYKKINKALSSLEYKAIALYVGGASASEIAETLDKDVKSISNALARAKKKILKLFGKEE